MGFLYLSVVVIYLVAMAVVGSYFSKYEVKSSDDFMLAGRRLPLLVLMGTLLATWVGSGTVVGGASFVYQRGPLASIFFFSGAPVGIIVLYFLAAKVRKVSRYTIPEILEMRYGSLARTLAAICILLAYVGITSYQFTGGGYVLNLTTGIPVQTGTLITAAFVIFLTLTGGMVSVAYTDFLSALLIVGGLLLGTPFTVSRAGGLSFFSKLPPAKLTWSGGLTVPQILGYFLPLLFLILGDQNMYQRFSSASSETVARKSNIGFFIGDVLVVSLVTICASAAVVLFPNIKPDTALLNVAVKAMPVPIGTILLAACVAFMITTGDSYLLSCSTNVTYDFYVRFINKNASQAEKLVFTRITVLVLGILAYVLGSFFPSVLAVQMYSYTMYGAAITPAVLAAFLWKRATPFGGTLSIIVGGAATLFWELVLKKPFGWNSILFSLPLSVLALVVGSLLTAPSDESTTKLFAD